MNRAKIEWARNPDGSLGYTWNPITGCLNHQDGLCRGGGFPCYAYRLAHGRLKQRYLDNRTVGVLGGNYGTPSQAYADPFCPRFWPERLEEQKKRYKQLQTCLVYAKKRGIFVCDMSDLFGIGIPVEWTRLVLEVIRINAYDRFYLLTKQPQNLLRWSPFPDNAWVGVTATSTAMFMVALANLEYPIQAKVKYISIEPLLEWNFHWEKSYLVNALKRADIGWLIIGACTGTFTAMVEICNRYPELTLMPCNKRWTLQPPIDWLQEIVEAADKAGIPVFLKHNLLELVNYHSPDTDFAFNSKGCYRQEMPEEVKQCKGS